MRAIVFGIFGVCVVAVLAFPLIAYGQSPVVDPSAAVDLVVGNATAYGVLGLVAAVLSVAVSMFAKFFPATWSTVPGIWRYIISVIVTGAGVGILASLGGAAIGAAITAGITGGLAAVGLNQGFKQGKKVAAKPVNPTPA